MVCRCKALLFLSLIYFIAAAPVKSQSIRINNGEYLFLDNELVEKTENITRRINKARKYVQNPVLIPDKPWEGSRVLLFGSVIFDQQENLFKMWYYCDGGHVAYATSVDGIMWKKPELDVVLRDGAKTNIVIERGNFGYFYEIFGVLKDDHDPDPTRRYKAGYVSIQKKYSGENEDPFHRGQKRGLGVATSPDGIHWTLENEFASYDICDISRFFWDQQHSKYILYGRTKLTEDSPDKNWKKWGWGRAVTRIESKDFKTWTKGELVLAADSNDPEGSEIYSMSVFPYSNKYIGCVQMFYGLKSQGNLDIQLACSHDGKNFTRISPREPFIPEGNIGEWDRFNIALGNLPPVKVGDELWFFYSARTYRHGPYDGPDSGPLNGAIGLARIKQGRFVSLESSFDGGYIETKPLLFTANKMFLNANTSFGSIKVSIVDENGKILSDNIVTRGIDDIKILVTSELQQYRNKPVKFRFELENAQLYGFEIND